MIPEFGSFALCLLIAISIAQLILPLIGIVKNKPELIMTAKLLSLAQLFFVGIAILILGYSFIVNDFSVAYVAHNSNSTLPLVYKITAIWGGHEGSILLWLAILVGWMNSIVYNKKIDKIFKASTLSIMASITLGISLFILITSNPFSRLLPNVPIDGLDLNPLLQDPGLIIHPPMLYLGYVGLSIPFALSLSYLLLPSSQTNFNSIIRPYVLAAYSFLTIGIVLGSWWAYYELGWGGWWMWDPVENASFIPWLMTTALLHTVIITKNKPNYISWVVFLSICCFALSLLGTFLVRSGVITSVHAFAVTPDRGLFILLFSVIIIGIALLIYTIRLPRLTLNINAKMTRKEILLLINSVGFFVLAASVLLGTIYPIITDAIWGQKISVGSPYFNKTFIPIFAFLLFMFAPSFIFKKYNVAKVLLISIAISALLLLVNNLLNLKLLFGLFLTFSIFFSMLYVIYKNYKARNIKYSKIIPMITAHMGLALLILGVTVVSIYSIEKDIVLTMGDSYNINKYNFKLNKVELIEGVNYFGNRAEFEITGKNNKTVIAKPEKRFFFVKELPMTETAIIPGVMYDLYIALCDELSKDKWSVRIYYKPGIRWIWFGGLLIAIGAMLGAILSKRNIYGSN